MRILPDPILFIWDAGNTEKSAAKHKVYPTEAEQAFFDQYRKLWKDVPHSRMEPRYILLGQSDTLQILFIVFTVRADRVRVISARPANKKERIMYATAKEAKKTATT